MDIQKMLDKLVGDIDYDLSRYEIESLYFQCYNHSMSLQILRNQAVLLEYFSVKDPEVFSGETQKAAAKVFKVDADRVKSDTDKHFLEIIQTYLSE